MSPIHALKAMLLAGLLVLQAEAVAQESPQIRRGSPIALSENSAHLLFRVDPSGRADVDFILVRELPGTDTATSEWAAPPRFDPDAAVIRTDVRYPYAEAPGEQTFILAVPPGSYVIAAATYKRMPTIGTCQCMGTVRFEARAGVINDLGFLLAAIEDRATTIPELAPYANPPTPTRATPAMLIMTVRPPAAGMSVPETLRGLPLVPARYRAVGKFPNYFHTMINRMAPIAGILDYEEDRVIDLQASSR